MTFTEIMTIVVASVIGGIVPAVAVVVTVRVKIETINQSITDLKYDLRNANKRLDDHILHWHMTKQKAESE